MIISEADLFMRVRLFCGAACLSVTAEGGIFIFYLPVGRNAVVDGFEPSFVV